MSVLMQARQHQWTAYAVGQAPNAQIVPDLADALEAAEARATAAEAKLLTISQEITALREYKRAEAVPNPDLWTFVAAVECALRGQPQ